jgi:hypothetical protein
VKVFLGCIFPENQCAMDLFCTFSFHETIARIRTRVSSPEPSAAKKHTADSPEDGKKWLLKKMKQPREISLKL